MPTIRLDETNYDWLDDQRQQISKARKESFNDVLDRMRKERGKDGLDIDLSEAKGLHSSVVSAEQVLDDTNKQPEGKFCYPDCAKFETKKCPYPGSNITTTYCNSFELSAADKGA